MNESYWISSSKGENYDTLSKDIDTEILIIGGGITGITTAYLLSKEGKEVTLVDAGKIGYSTSGKNTGKVTTLHEIVYSKIKDKYGIESASLYYEFNNEGLELVRNIVKEHNIKCYIKSLPAYVFTNDKHYEKELKKEYEICRELGIDCEYLKQVNIPIEIKGALKFNNQIQFNPKIYIDALGRIATKQNVKIYENTPIVNIEEGDTVKLKTKDNNTIRAKEVIFATHIPWYDGFNLFFAKEKGDRSYLVGAEYDKSFEEGMYLGLEEPKITFRICHEEKNKMLFIGGEDHKVGQGKREELSYKVVESYARDKFGVDEFKYRWSSQDYMSFDNLPFIGHINKKSNNIYVTTGYSKWGMTNGSGAAILIKDLIINKSSKYGKVFNPSRKGVLATKDFVKENMNVAIEYIEGKLRIGSDKLPRNKGEGKIVNIDGKRYGAYRHYNNELYIVDITCTHLGCELKFNSAEKTWDCPCHASRFDYEGNVVEGPALRNLKRYEQGKNIVDPKL